MPAAPLTPEGAERSPADTAYLRLAPMTAEVPASTTRTIGVLKVPFASTWGSSDEASVTSKVWMSIPWSAQAPSDIQASRPAVHAIARAVRIVRAPLCDVVPADARSSRLTPLGAPAPDRSRSPAAPAPGSRPHR